MPGTYHPFADNMADGELRDLMARVRAGIAQLVARQPTHREYIDRLCRPAAGYQE
jgi:hypothetical protein